MCWNATSGVTPRKTLVWKLGLTLKKKKGKKEEGKKDNVQKRTATNEWTNILWFTSWKKILQFTSFTFTTHKEHFNSIFEIKMTSFSDYSLHSSDRISSDISYSVEVINTTRHAKTRSKQLLDSRRQSFGSWTSRVIGFKWRRKLQQSNFDEIWSDIEENCCLTWPMGRSWHASDYYGHVA